jgi:hypothetical protein
MGSSLPSSAQWADGSNQDQPGSGGRCWQVGCWQSTGRRTSTALVVADPSSAPSGPSAWAWSKSEVAMQSGSSFSAACSDAAGDNEVAASTEGLGSHVEDIPYVRTLTAGLEAWV